MANPKPDCDAEFTLMAERVGTPEEMIALGRQLGERVDGPRCISLNGPLGAGKTQLVKGIALGLGSADAVSSPTFTLVHEYQGGRLPLVHFDFYRLESEADLESIGWDDYLADSAVLVIEWGDRFAHRLPEETLRIEIAIDGDARVLRVREFVSRNVRKVNEG